MATIIFDAPPEKKLELARKVMACEGNRTTSGVATKEQVGLTVKDQLLQTKAESVHMTHSAIDVPNVFSQYTLENLEQMESMNPENWVYPKHKIEEYLDISDLFMLGAVCEVPKIVQVQLYRETDTVEMKVTFYLENHKAIQIFLEPGVVMLNLLTNPFIAIKPNDLEHNRVLGEGRELYSLPDERSEVVEILNHNAEVELINQQDGIDADTGVQWTQVRTKKGNFGWMPKAAISQFSVLFGEPVVDCHEQIDYTLRASVIYSNDEDQEILEVHKQTLAAVFEQLLVTQLQKYLTSVAMNQLKVH